MSETRPWTVLALLNWTKDYFQRQGIDSPRLCSEMLLAHCLGCRRVELYARFAEEPDDALRRRFRELVRRAAEGVPVAYLVGEKEFYSLPIKVTPDVLIPRPESELLVDRAVEHLRAVGEGALGWDACTGSGCVGLAVAHNAPAARVLLTDVSEAAVAVARDNAEQLGLADRVHAAPADLLNLPPDWDGDDTFDVITANPPYVSEGDPLGMGVDKEPSVALYGGGEDGLDLVRRLIAAAPPRLKPGGLFCMEFGLGQADDVRDLIVATDAFDEPRMLLDQQQLERTAVTVRR
jgi:release factor glutamine methyltransferase